MNASDVQFLPIDLDRHADLAIRYCADTFVCSFGTAERFYAESGRDGRGLIDWLRARMARVPGSCSHMWLGSEIIGQLHLDVRGDPTHGYVNQFYLRPDFRGRGFGRQQDEFAEAFFAARGINRAQLSVSPQNARARRFYERRGWRDLGPRPDAPNVHLMEIAYASRGGRSER